MPRFFVLVKKYHFGALGVNVWVEAHRSRKGRFWVTLESVGEEAPFVFVSKPENVVRITAYFGGLNFGGVFDGSSFCINIK